MPQVQVQYGQGCLLLHWRRWPVPSNLAKSEGGFPQEPELPRGTAVGAREAAETDGLLTQKVQVAAARLVNAVRNTTGKARRRVVSPAGPKLEMASRFPRLQDYAQAPR